MKKLTLAVLAAAAASTTPAMAQDAPGGFYVGAVAGYEGIDVESGTGSVTADADAVVYGITAGYDLSLGNAFVGVEGEISTSDSTAQFPDNFAGARDGLDADGQYYLGARAGVALTPGIAAYGKIGYTALDTRVFTQAGSLNDLDETAEGLRFGGGLQIQLPGPLEGRLEYRRSQYNDLDDADFGEASSDQVVVGLGLRF